MRGLKSISLLIGVLTVGIGAPNWAIASDLATLDSLMIKHDRDIQRAALSIERIKTQQAAVTAGYRPIITVSASTRATSREQNNITERFEADTLNLTARQPILDGVLLLEHDRLEALVGSEQALLELTTQSRRLALVREYMRLMSASAEYELIREQIASLDEKFRAISRLVEANRLTRLDILSVEAEQHRINARMAKVRVTIDSAISALRDLTGHTIEKPWSTNAINYDDWPFDSNYGELRTIESHSHPNALAQEFKRQSAQISLRQVERGRWPSVVATAEMTQTNTGSDFTTTPKTDVWSVGLTLQWTLFDSGRQSAQVAEATINMIDANLALEQAKQDIEERGIQSHLALETARETWSESKRAVENALELAQLSDQRLNRGVGTVSEALLAISRITEARARQRSSWAQGLVSFATQLADLGSLDKNAIEQLAKHVNLK